MAMTAADALDRFQRLGGQRWFAAVERRGPAIAVLLLALIIAWQLAGLFWAAWPQRPDADITPPVAASTASGPESGQATAGGPDVTPIVDAHLFGVAGADPTPETGPVPEDVPEFVGNLQLRGTLASNSEENALAIIADGRDEKVYRIGARVQNGVTLHSVQREQVLLSRAGVLEALKLPRPEEQQASGSANISRARPSIRRAPSQPTMSQLVTRNAAQLTQIISPRPYFVDGQQRGYRLYPGTDRRSFAKLGLRAGDVVTAINGTPLTDPSQGARVFSELGSAQSVTVTLERGGQEQTLTLDTSALDFSNQATQ